MVDDHGSVTLVVQRLGAAWSAQQLYPASSPMLFQALESASDTIAEHLDSEPSLRLVVSRRGFFFRGSDKAVSSRAATDFADALASHAIAEVLFVAPPTPEETLAFITAAREKPPEAGEHEDPMVVELDGERVQAIRLMPVSMVDAVAQIELPEYDPDSFLMGLTNDLPALVTWMRSLLTYGDEGLIEGLLRLSSAAGGPDAFGESLSRAFFELGTECTDRLLETAATVTRVRPITAAMLSDLTTTELVAAIRGGRYGANPLALSWMLVHLPLGGRSAELVDDAMAALASADASEEETALLRRLIDARQLDGPEPTLAESRPDLTNAGDASTLDQASIEQLRATVEAGRIPDVSSIKTVLHLVEVAEDYDSFSRVVDALARTVPRLLEEGDPKLAVFVVRTLAQSDLASGRLWPDIGTHMKRATELACGPRSMAALLGRFGGTSESVEYAREFISLAHETAALALAEAVLVSGDVTHLRWAHEVLDQRLAEVLAQRATRANGHNVAELATILARDGGPASIQALEGLAQHDDETIRAGTARGVSDGTDEVVAKLMPILLRDGTHGVLTLAARSLGQRGDGLSLKLLAARLVEFEDDADLPAAREVIGALATHRSPAAAEALRQFADGGPHLRKNRSAEMRGLAEATLRTGEGGTA